MPIQCRWRAPHRNHDTPPSKCTARPIWRLKGQWGHLGSRMKQTASPTDAQDGIGHEIDADFLEYPRREAASGGIPGGEQAELPWDTWICKA